MEIAAQTLNSEETLRVKFRKDYKFLRFYLLPFLKDFSTDIRWMAEKVGVDLAQAFEYQDLLVQSGYWTRNATGGISATENYERFKKNFDGILTAAEFMTLSANISSRISDSGACWFETFTICTTKELEAEYIKGLNSLLKDFRAKSEQAKGENIISWSQVYTHALNTQNDSKENAQ